MNTRGIARRQLSIRVKLFSAIIPVVTLAVAGTLLISIVRMRAMYVESLTERARDNARNLRSIVYKNLESFSLEGIVSIAFYLERMVSNNGEFSYAFIADRQGIILHHTDGAQRGRQLNPTLYRHLGLRGIDRDKGITVNVGRYYETILPLVWNADFLGTLHIGINKKLVTAMVASAVRQGIEVLLWSLLIAFVVLYVLLNRHIIRPLNALAVGVAKIGKGDLRYRVKAAASDELGDLAVAFNKMAEDLQANTVSIDALTREIAEHEKTERRLHESKLLQNALLDNIPDIAWLKDKESRFIAVNEPFVRACGFKPEELVGKTDLDIWPRELAERYRADDQEVMESGLRKRVEEPLADKEGKIKWIETIKTPIYNERGEVVGTTGIAHDMTERRQMEERLREIRSELEIRVKVRTAELTKLNEDLHREVSARSRSEERLAQLNQTFLCFSADPLENINRLTALAGTLLGAESALYNHLQEGMLCAWGKWKVPEDFQALVQPQGHICYDVIRNADGQIAQINDLQSTEYAITDPNVMQYNLHTYIGQAVKCAGAYVGSLCLLYQRPVTIGEEDKKLLSLIASAIGVEETRHQAEETLKASQERFRKIASAVTDYIFTVKIKDGVPTETIYGPTCVNVTGYTADEFAHDPLLWIKMVPEEDHPLVRQQAERILKGHEAERIEHRLLGKDGTIRWVRNTAVLYYDISGNLIAYDGLVRDITERKLVEEEILEQNKFLNDVLESLTHPFYVVDASDRTVLMSNSAAREYFSASSCGGTCVTTVDAVKAAKAPVSIPHTHLTVDQKLRVYEVHGFPLFDRQGKVVKVLEYALELPEKNAEARTQ